MFQTNFLGSQQPTFFLNYFSFEKIRQKTVYISCCYLLPEVESSRTQFEVLGLEASSARKLRCPRLEDSNIFEPLQFCWKTPETSRKICEDLFLVFLNWRSPKKIFFNTFFAWKKHFEDLFYGEHLRLSSWSLALASDFFCVLGLEPWVLDSTSACCLSLQQCTQLYSTIFLCECRVLRHSSTRTKVSSTSTPKLVLEYEYSSPGPLLVTVLVVTLDVTRTTESDGELRFFVVFFCW